MRYTVSRVNSDDRRGHLCTFANRTVWMAAAVIGLSMSVRQEAAVGGGGGGDTTCPLASSFCQDFINDCIGTDADLCQVTSALGSSQGPRVTGCGCFSDDQSDCGAVDVITIPGTSIITDFKCLPAACPDPDEFCNIYINGNDTGQTSLSASDLQPGLTLTCDCPDTDPKGCEGKGSFCGDADDDCVCETRPDGTLNCADAKDFFSGRDGFCFNFSDEECEAQTPGTKCFVNSNPPVCAHNCGNHPPPPDPHITIQGTSASFGTADVPAIPADFFGPGADPFAATVNLVGGPTDTLGQRDGPIVCPGAGFPRACDPVGVELVQLDLVSAAPVIVTFNGGLFPELWDVAVDLSPGAPSTPGVLSATLDHANGGKYNTNLIFSPRFTFTQVANPLNVRVLDYDLEGTQPIEINFASVPWVINLGALLSGTIDAPNDGNFVPGVRENIPGNQNSQKVLQPLGLSKGGGIDHPIQIPPVLEACCFDDGTCLNLPPSQCRGSDGAPRGPGTACQGDANRNGIDDACEFDTKCEHCGPGFHWIDTCAAGHDRLPSGAVLGIDLTGDCQVDTNLVMFGPAEVARGAGSPHSITTEMVALKLSGGGAVLRAGAGGGIGPGAPLGASPGQIVEDGGDPSLGDSSFDILFELDLGGGVFAYNQVPLTLTASILCVSPNRIYSHPEGCFPLFDSPDPGTGNLVANLVTANHDPFADPKGCEGKGESCGDATQECVCETRPDGTLNCADAKDFLSGRDGFCPNGSDDECETQTPGTKCFVNVPPGASPVCAHNCGKHPPLPDPHVTLQGTSADFGSGDVPAIPADFFGPGADPFTDTVNLVGGPTDTLGQRDGPIVCPGAGFPRPCDAVGVELIQLDLVSAAPVIVTFNGGLNPEPWDVTVELSPTAPSTPGVLSALLTHANGGTYSTNLIFSPRFTFTEVANAANVRVLDYDQEGIPPIEINFSGVNWVVNLGALLVATFDAPNNGNFVPGVKENTPGDANSQKVIQPLGLSKGGGIDHPIQLPPVLCPLPDPDGTVDPCAALQKTDCIGSPLDVCLPNLLQVVNTGATDALSCTCYDPGIDLCGPIATGFVDGALTVSCAGACVTPNLPPCQIWEDLSPLGLPPRATGKTSAPVGQFPPGTLLYCDCGPRCTNDDDCDDGIKCTQDTCLPDGTCVTTQIPGCCASDLDCPGKCQVCDQVNNVCAKRAGCCTSDDQCSKCEVCDLASNACVVALPVACCETDSDCPGKCDICITSTNECVKGIPGCCDSDDQCSKCSRCDLDLNVCIDIGNGTCCESDADCPPDPKCQDSFCDQTTNTCELSAPLPGCCTNDFDCLGFGTKCRLGLCNTLTNICFTGPKTPPECCETDAQCADFGTKCRPGLCDQLTNICFTGSKTPPECCETDAQCADFGTKCRPGLCDQLTNICFTGPKTPPDCCETDAQCADFGTKCRPGICDPLSNRCDLGPKRPPECCESDDQCSKCELCNMVTNRCDPPPPPSDCCTSDEDCDKCEFCDVGVNKCFKEDPSDCCARDSDCPKCDVCNLNTNTCFRPAGTTCCTSEADCPNKCQNCNLVTNVCETLLFCCKSDDQCPDKCDVCDLSTNRCVKGVPGCCDSDDQCEKCEFCDPGTNTCFRPLALGTACCTTDAECDDGDPCTIDRCDLVENICLHIPDPECGEPCCHPDGTCKIVTAGTCDGKVVAACLGDGDGNGIDDACQNQKCDNCPPGEHWVDRCPPADPTVPGICKITGDPCLLDSECEGTCSLTTVLCSSDDECSGGGDVCVGRTCNRITWDSDTFPTGAVLGIDLNFDCIADTSVVMRGISTITKHGPFDDSINFPGKRPNDLHKDVVDTEIVYAKLTGGGVTLEIGTALGLNPTLGNVAELPLNPFVARSKFDVLARLTGGGLAGPAYNWTPIRVTADITCLPPNGRYIHFGGCTPLYATPKPVAGEAPIANLVRAIHFPFPDCCIPDSQGKLCQCLPLSATDCEAAGGVPSSCLGDSDNDGCDDACNPPTERCPAPAGQDWCAGIPGCEPTSSEVEFCEPTHMTVGLAGPIATACACSREGSDCGPIRVLTFPNSPLAVFSCKGVCEDGTTNCLVHVNGVSTGKVEYESAIVQAGDDVTCECLSDTCQPTPDGSGCENFDCPSSGCFGECIGGAYCDDPNCCIVKDSCVCYAPNTKESIKYCGDCFGECIGGAYCDGLDTACCIGGLCACYSPNTDISIQLCGDCFGTCDENGYCDPENRPDCALSGAPACYGFGTPEADKLCGRNVPVAPDVCRTKCVNYNPVTGIRKVTQCDCIGDSGCQVNLTGISTDGSVASFPLPTCEGLCGPGGTCTRTEVMNADGTIDICCDCCPVPDPPKPEPKVFPKNRYISFIPNNPGQLTSLRVRLVSAPDHPDSVGAEWWVGPPRTVCENGGEIEPPADGCGPAPSCAPNPTMLTSDLQCTPHCRDWGSLEQVLDVGDANIVPNAVYEVEAVACDCETSPSEALLIRTSIWGDAVGPYGGCPAGYSQPDNSVDIVTDVTALLSKFQNLLESPTKAQSDLEPEQPDRQNNISDVTFALNAFGGAEYPFSSPTRCPPPE